MLANLNSKQKLAIETTVGPIIIRAGPGTGKTKTLVSKIYYLINNQNINPYNILALTFTKKATNEIQERLENNLETLPLISTFHALGHTILSEQKQNIQIISDKDKNELIKEILKSKNIDASLKSKSIKEISLNISRIKNLDSTSQISEDMKQLVSTYNHALKRLDLYDYDDLVAKAFNLIQKGPILKQKLNQRFKYILVDEFQDTNQIQYELIKQILGTNNICVIGDPKQSIYAFRGANTKIFAQFKNDFPNHKEISLDINYRSTPHIIQISSLIFPQEIKLIPHKKQQGEVKLIKTMNEHTEADWILSQINKKIGGIDLIEAGNVWGEEDEDIHLSDFAVIYRTHNLNKNLEKKFIDSGIPYQIVGGESLYEQKEISFIISCIEYLLNKDEKLFQEIITSPFVNETNIKELQKLHSIAKKTKLSTLVSTIINIFNLEKHLEDRPYKLLNLTQFNSTTFHFDKYDNSVEKFIEYINYLINNEYYDYKSHKVTLLTMHAAKGLEFKYVFICGFEDGSIPLIKKDSEDNNLEEEKRLFYVAMTRAKKSLYILSAKERKGKKDIEISRFKKLISSNLLVEQEDEAIHKIQKKRQKQKAKKAQMKLF